MAAAAAGWTIVASTPQERTMELHDPHHDTVWLHEFEAAIGLMLFTTVAMIVAIGVLLIL